MCISIKVNFVQFYTCGNEIISKGANKNPSPVELEKLRPPLLLLLLNMCQELILAEN